MGPKEIKGPRDLNTALVDRVLRMVNINEYKRETSFARSFAFHQGLWWAGNTHLAKYLS